MMDEEYLPHPLYEDRVVRAIFSPLDIEGLNDGAKQMVGHEFVWKHVGYTGNMPVWVPADPEDIDAYFEVVGAPCPDMAVLWILEEDLDIMRVEKFDG
jgi:hypothetical protein